MDAKLSAFVGWLLLAGAVFMASLPFDRYLFGAVTMGIIREVAPAVVLCIMALFALAYWRTRDGQPSRKLNPERRTKIFRALFALVTGALLMFIAPLATVGPFFFKGLQMPASVGLVATALSGAIGLGLVGYAVVVFFRVGQKKT